MKKTAVALCCIVPLFFSVAEAAEKKTKKSSKNSPWYMAIKAGLMDSAGLKDSALNLGFDLGYRHNTYLSTEIEITETMIEGETPSGNDWNVDTLSIFAAFRSNTDVKLKGKIGITDIDRNGNRDLEVSFGIGIGFWAAGGLMEIEYTELDDGLDFFSVGVNYFF